MNALAAHPLTRKPSVAAYAADPDGFRATVRTVRRVAPDRVRLAQRHYPTHAEALHAAVWAAEHPEDYPPGRECPDHAWVQCLGCGRTVSDPAGIDLWNGYGSGPCGCDPDTTRSMWTRYDGTWTAILDGRVMDEGTWPDTNR